MENDVMQNIQSINEFGITATINDKKVQMINIIGQIEGHLILPPQNKTTKYEHMIPKLLEIEQSDEIDGFIMILNTAGGDVEAGLALAEMVAGMSKPCVSLVLGGGHSIGVCLAVSADYSYVSKTASITIHPIRMNGMIISIPQTFEYFNKMQERIIDFVCDHSKIKKEEYKTLMFKTGDLANDTGTVLVGKEAVEKNIIDEPGGLKIALEKLYYLINNKKVDKN
jgi:ATP-dependent protease ClpP protease subunit